MRGFIVCCIAVWLGPAAAQTGVYDDLPMDVMEHGETPHDAVARIRTGDGDDDQAAPFSYRPTAERYSSAEARQFRIDPSLRELGSTLSPASEPLSPGGGVRIFDGSIVQVGGASPNREPPARPDPPAPTVHNDSFVRIGFDGGGSEDDRDEEHDERDAERDRDRAERDAERNEEREEDDDREEDAEEFERDRDRDDRDADRDDDDGGDDGDDD